MSHPCACREAPATVASIERRSRALSGWRDLGHAAEFATVREEFVAPSNLFRMHRFQA